MGIPLIDRVLNKTIAGRNACWIFTGSQCTSGYGRIKFSNGSRRYAHRIAYEALVGPIPIGLQLDHLCHTRDPLCAGGVTCLHRRCVNPDHLEPVTNAENSRRGSDRKAQRTHCGNGHELTPENTRIEPNRDRTRTRCRECVRIRQRTKSTTRRATTRTKT